MEYNRLTENDKRQIAQVAMDMETGNDLLGYPRSDEYKAMRVEVARAFKTAKVARAFKTAKLTERQHEIIQYLNFCTNGPT